MFLEKQIYKQKRNQPPTIRRPLPWARGGRNTGRGCRARGNRTSANLGASTQRPPEKPSAHAGRPNSDPGVLRARQGPATLHTRGGPPAPTPCGPHREGGRAASTTSAAPPRGRGSIGTGQGSWGSPARGAQHRTGTLSTGACAATQRQRHRARGQVLPALMKRGPCTPGRGGARHRETPPGAHRVPGGTAAQRPRPKLRLHRGVLRLGLGGKGPSGGRASPTRSGFGVGAFSKLDRPG